MPRTGKGGARTGSVGTAYANRTDLNSPEPIVTVPNQAYGDATEQRQMQGAIPMAPSDQSVPAPVSSGPNAEGAGSPVVPVPQSPPSRGAAPGSLPWMHPTNRPNEPITHGMPFGPGAGPEAMGTPVIPNKPITAQLDQIAQSPDAAPQLSAIADAARILGI